MVILVGSGQNRPGQVLVGILWSFWSVLVRFVKNDQIWSFLTLVNLGIFAHFGPKMAGWRFRGPGNS